MKMVWLFKKTQSSYQVFHQVPPLKKLLNSLEKSELSRYDQMWISQMFTQLSIHYFLENMILCQTCESNFFRDSPFLCLLSSCCCSIFKRKFLLFSRWTNELVNQKFGCTKIKKATVRLVLNTLTETISLIGALPSKIFCWKIFSINFICWNFKFVEFFSPKNFLFIGFPIRSTSDV